MSQLKRVCCVLPLAAVLIWGQDSGGPGEEAAQRAPDERDKVYFSEETESVKPLARKMFRNVILDEKDIFTSPFHMRKKDVPWWILIGGTTGAFIAGDHTLSTQLPNSKDQVAFSRHVSEIGAAYTTLPIAAGFYLYGAFRDDPKARETGVLGGQALLDSLITVEVLKVIFRRERPLEGSGKGHFFKGTHDAFPSGHSMMTFAFASLVSHEYEKYKIAPFIAYGLSTLVAASRFSARKHFASDILAGAGAGWFIGRYVFQTHVDHAIHHRPVSKLKSALTPTIQPQIGLGGTYGVALDWHL